MFPYTLPHKSVRNAWGVFVNNALCFQCDTFVPVHVHFTEPEWVYWIAFEDVLPVYSRLLRVPM